MLDAEVRRRWGIRVAVIIGALFFMAVGDLTSFVSHTWPLLKQFSWRTLLEGTTCLAIVFTLAVWAAVRRVVWTMRG